jgi:uncharacterized protein YyaL (SSP411 family)
MKRIIFITLTTLVICSFTNVEELKWNSWNDGYELAKNENKPMLVFVHATWCHICKRLDDKTFNNEEVAAQIIKDFIPVKLDIEAKENYIFEGKEITGKELLEQISKKTVMGIPTTLFYTPDGRKGTPVGGLMDTDEMKALLSENR